MLTEEQKALRRTGVGASESAAALGMSPYQTRFNLWQVKRGEIEPDPENIAMRFGNAAEPFILNEFKLAHPEFYVEAAPPTMRRGRMLAHLDAWCPGHFNVQIKTASSRVGWGEPGSDEIPQHYLIQVQHEMLLASVPVTFVPVFFAGRDYAEYVVYADAELQEMVEDGVNEFWRLVESGEPPEPTTLIDMPRRWRGGAGDMQADADLMQWLGDLQALKQQSKDIEAAEETLKGWVFKAMADREAVLAPDGRLLATWKPSKGRVTLDADALKADHPEIFKQYLKTGAPSRRFTLKD
jgi:putative phage-type endonuclease